MKTLECPSCKTSFQMAAQALQGRATVHCPACGRIVIVAAGPDVARAPDDPDTNAYVEPAAEGELPTAVGAARAVLSLPSDKRVSVVILSGERKSEVVVLEQPTILIGRQGGGAEIQVADADVSRRHAAIDCHGQRIVIRDLGSRNGTFVGEQRVETSSLEDKAEFRLGSTRFMLLLSTLD